MTFAFGSLTLGAVLLISAFKNQNIIDTLLGRAGQSVAEQNQPHSGGIAAPGGATGDMGNMGSVSGTPKDVVNNVTDWAHRNGFPNVTRTSVRLANAAHGPTVDGNTSDHQGPPSVRWAGDYSNGSRPTKEMDRLARAIAKAFNIPWDGSGLVSVNRGRMRLQLIYRTTQGGNHFNHVHFGAARR